MNKGVGYGKALSRALRLLSLVVLCLGMAALSTAQQTPANPAAPPDKPRPEATPSPNSTAANVDTKSEVSIKETGPTVKIRVNLVQVRVVVRDSNGRLVDNLRREDFVLYDQGKLQNISNFSVETLASRRQRAEAAAHTQQQEDKAEESSGPQPVLPDRFVALVVDDAHLTLEDASFLRVSAQRLFDDMAPTDRVGIYSTSGQIAVEFTSDRAALREALLRIVPRPIFSGAGRDCPEVTHYQADQIENKHNDQAFGVVLEETIQCAFDGDESKVNQARPMALGAVLQALSAGDNENEQAYRHLEDALRRLSTMPGERVLLLASPGFLLSTQFLDEMGIIDRANHSNIVINVVDVRGLYAPDVMGDISQRSHDSYKTIGYKATYRIEAQQEQSFVLRDFAYGTGGTLFHNSNDLEGGLKRAGAAPEISYVLAFSPQNQKMDGRYHTLKVGMAGKQKYEIQARRGYYAPRKVNDPAEQERAEIQEAVFSQDEIQELPLDLQTQYFKSDASGAHLSVVSRIEVKAVRFRKVDGRNFDSLTFATAIFDENGNFVTGGGKTLQMRLLDTTYEKLMRTGLTVKSSFDLKPGRYLVRQVVRDSEGAQMAARNGAINIPF